MALHSCTTMLAWAHLQLTLKTGVLVLNASGCKQELVVRPSGTQLVWKPYMKQQCGREAKSECEQILAVVLSPCQMARSDGKCKS